MVCAQDFCGRPGVLGTDGEIGIKPEINIIAHIKQKISGIDMLLTKDLL